MHKYEYSENSIKTINADGFSIPFNADNFGFFVYAEDEKVKIDVKKSGSEYLGIFNNLKFTYSFSESEAYLAVNLKIENLGEEFKHKISFGMGIDSYMTHYPQWNEKFFPTLLRCEKTHLWGYYMNTAENSVAVVTSGPVASYDILYNIFYEENYPHNGHRILGTELVPMGDINTISRCSQNLKALKLGSVYENTIYYLPVKNKEDIKKSIAKYFDIPIVDAPKYTLEKNEKLSFVVLNNENYKCILTSPKGEEIKDLNTNLCDFGLYKLTVWSQNKKECEAMFYVRNPWDYYLEKASENAFLKPQKASTHVESYYGLFSAFLHCKHSGNSEVGEKALSVFNEIMPLMFDFKNHTPLVIPERIQNTALTISLLCDIYESNPHKNFEYLKHASEFADFLISHQSPDGAYRSHKIHYTCVIYIAKSLLELYLCEKNCGIKELEEKSLAHYESVTKAIDELVSHLDNIETEGEMTLEDGMISCSALQIGMYALTLSEEKRKPYTDAAEYMMKLHSCLEQQLIPDCRTNGASLRYWESQYDVMLRVNMLNSPHGWSGWTAYAHYYLYMLTGKKNYLLSLMNCLGACSQLVSEDGNLRWAYCPQPYVKGDALVADTSKEVTDGYKKVYTKAKAYRGIYQTKEYGEEYIDMISSWYRTGEQRLTGGYEFCHLYMADKTIKDYDHQGGCCDNDVHEIFKCIEETVMDKAFIHQNEDGSYTTYGCYLDGNKIIANSNEKTLVYKINNPTKFCINSKECELCGFSTLKI
ncbi:MAG: hypothetical protein IKJ68_04930 [Clostridia bacterium]|nr:hypothetical protein [Clostridia bacterium]